jgi:hypothetical protein
VFRRYEQLHPTWRVVFGTTAGAWSKGAAVADGLKRATGDVVVVADADSFVAKDILEHAVTLAAESPWVMPHRRVFRLSPESTLSLFELGIVDVPGQCRARRHKAPVGGGIVVARREVFDQVCIDPRFVGWGGDDVSFGRALDTLVGLHVQLFGVLYHGHHPDEPTRQNATAETNALAGRYLEAHGNPAAMRALLDEP